MTNINRAADILAEAGAYCGQCCFGECGIPDCSRDDDWRACPDCAAVVTGYARALADAGLLAPDPQIIRTREELAALDPGTLLESNGAYNRAFEAKHPQWIAAQGRRVGRGWLPAVVIATGDQVRAARQALKEATE